MEINGATSFACLLGSPVAHSLSPAMHNLAFEHNGINSVYLAFDVAPGALRAVVSGLAELGCMGFNLTMPLKRDIIPLLDEISPVSRLCGAVNTVAIKDGRLLGTTTDGAGLFDSLKHEEGIDLDGGRMVLLGAGGAATAIAAEGALNHLSSISIFRRKNERWADTQAFVDALNEKTGCRAGLFDIADESALKREISMASILCNGTNVGMGDDDRSPVSSKVLDPSVLVYDIIYHPEVTPLMREAERAGAASSNGKYMLIYQGAAAFRIWTGRDMPIEKVKQKVFSK